MRPNKPFRARRSPIGLLTLTMPPKLSVLDILHRTVVYSLVGISVYGIGMGVVVHRDTLRRGREVLEERVALGLPTTVMNDEVVEQKEKALAELAQAAVPGRNQ